jgi:hypothetical protein
MLAPGQALGGCKGGVQCPGREPFELAASYLWLASMLRLVPAALALAIALAGCKSGEWCPGREPLDDAASYRGLISEQRYLEQLNAWVRNEPLETFLLKAYRDGGLDALRSRHGFVCNPRTVTPPCDSCFTCRRTIAKTAALGEAQAFHCQVGEMSIEADFGPGWTASVMTYWKRPPAGTPIPPSLPR